MDTHYGKKEDRSGVRLISLLGNHLKEILKRESDNRAFIHLYCTGPYWVAFEKSAYLLRQISSRTLVTPLSLTTYPFPIVMVSWTDGELRSYTCNHLSIAKAMTTVGYPSLLVRLTVTRSGIRKR